MKRIIFLFFIGTSMAFSQASRTIHVGVLLDRASRETAPVFETLKKEIRAVMGPDVNVLFKDALENNLDIEKATSNYKELLKGNTDIILSFGVINTMALSEQKTYPKPILIFGSVNSDFVTIPIGQQTSEVNNVNYIISPFSYSEDLAKFKELFDYKSIGIIVDDFLVEKLPIVDFFTKYFSNKEADYRLVSSNDILNSEKALDSLDAVYLTGTFNFGADKTKILIDSINANDLPSFSANGTHDVVKGVLATQFPAKNSEHFFRRIALNFESIATGTNASELPIYVDYKKSLTVNYNTATQIDFPLRYSMLGDVDFVESEIHKKTDYSLSLLDVMQGALNANLSLQSEQKNNELFEQDVQSAKNNYLPDLTVGAGATYVDPELAEVSFGQNPELSTKGNVTLQQLIYEPNASANKTVQKELSKAQKEVYNAAELDLMLESTVAYFNSLVYKTNVNIQNQNLQVTKLNLELAEQNFEEGASGKSDVLRFKSQLAQNTQSLVEAANQLRQSFNKINSLLNKKIGTKMDIDDAVISEGLFENYNYDKISLMIDDPRMQPKLIEFLTQEAERNAPELKNLAYNLEAINRNYKLNASGRFLPTVALQGQYNYFFSRDGAGSTPVLGTGIPDGSYNIGLNVSLPIFQKNLRNVARKSAEIQQEQIALEEDNLHLVISQNINNIVSDIATQIANIKITKIAEETAKESLELTQTAYKNGAVPVIQLIDAQTNYLQAQLGSANASYGYLLTSIQLERAIGYFFLLHSDEENQAFIDRANSYFLNEK